MRLFGIENVYLQADFEIMKRIILSILAALACCSAFSQQVRTNYRSGGFTHISTEYEAIKLSDNPSEVRVELVGLPDGSSMYLLYINLYQKQSVVAPKGVKMSATLPSGKFVRLDQIGQDSATKARLEDGTFRNRLKYAAESQDIEKLIKGVKSIDLVTGWNPDDYVQASFPQDEFAKLLKSHCEAILKAADTTIELSATIGARTDNKGSTLTTSNPVMARGASMDYNVILSHLYYKNTGNEDIDLAVVLGTSAKHHIPYDAPVVFTLRDGSSISLIQARDDVNFFYVYPSIQDLHRMAEAGVASISIECEDGTVTDTIPASDEDFSNAINQQLQLLLSVSPR